MPASFKIKNAGSEINVWAFNSGNRNMVGNTCTCYVLK